MKNPVTLEIGGQETTFSPDNSECRVYRRPEWDGHNHTQVLEYGSQVKRIFQAPRLIMYLTGVQLEYPEMPAHDLEQLTSAMFDEFGWNTKLVIEDEPDETIQKKFIQLIAPELIKPELYVPELWK